VVNGSTPSDSLPIQVADACFLVSREKGDLDFWSSVSNATWESPTYKALSDVLTPNSTFVDVGAWIGPITLYAAQLAKATIAIEPDPVAFEALERNLTSNAPASWVKKVKLINRALSSTPGNKQLRTEKVFGNSMSTLLDGATRTSVTVPSITMRQVLDFCKTTRVVVKMDIEGGEFDAIDETLHSLTGFEYTLLLSLHPFLIETSSLRRRGAWRFRRYLVRRRAMFRLLHSLRGHEIQDFGGKKLRTSGILLQYAFRMRYPTDLVVRRSSN